MNEQLFDVVFFGILQTGKDKAIVIQNMATLFKSEPSKLAAYFVGGRKVIKGQINANVAEKYRVALENVGLVIKVEPCKNTKNEKAEVAGEAEKNIAKSNHQSEQTTPEPLNSEQSNPKQSNSVQSNSVQSNPDQLSREPDDTPADITELTVAPVGVDVLEQANKITVQKIDDISNISMAEPGADIIENPVETPAQEIADIHGLTLADTGSNVLDHPAVIIAQEINDITDITMADVGADLITSLEPEKQTDIPDTSHLTLDTTAD